MSLSASSSCCLMKNALPGNDSYLIGLSASNVTGGTLPASSSFVSCCAYSVILAATESNVSGDCCAIEPMIMVVKDGYKVKGILSAKEHSGGSTYVGSFGPSSTTSQMPLFPSSAGSGRRYYSASEPWNKGPDHTHTRCTHSFCVGQTFRLVVQLH